MKLTQISAHFSRYIKTKKSGHTKCGAVKGACDHVEMGNLTVLLTKIRPAVDDETETKEKKATDTPIADSNLPGQEK